LREQYFGRWEGWTYEEIVAEEKDAFDRWMGDIWKVRPPEGECFQEMYRRVVKEIQGIVASCSGPTVGVVAHTGSIAAVVMETLGMPPERMWNLRVSPASISILRCYGNRWILERLNDVCHLRGI
jgi:broad specificity phosphatase PhoE